MDISFDGITYSEWQRWYHSRTGIDNITVSGTAVSQSETRGESDLTEITIIGCGGGGSHLAYFIMRDCAEHKNTDYVLQLVDDDIVEQRNLDRQLFLASTVGKPKVDALKETLEALGKPDNVRIITFKQKITNKLEASIYSGTVFVCTDNLKSKRLFADCRVTENVYFLSCDKNVVEVKSKLDSADMNAWTFGEGYSSTQTFFSNMFAVTLAYGMNRLKYHSNAVLKLSSVYLDIANGNRNMPKRGGSQ